MIEIQTIDDVTRALQQLKDRVKQDGKLFPMPGILDPTESMRIARLIQQIDDDSMRQVLARMTGTYDAEMMVLEKRIEALEQRSRIEATNAK